MALLKIWEYLFSNSLRSLIIHHKSQAWRRFEYPVLICIDFGDFTLSFCLSFLFPLRRYIKHPRQCFIGYPNTSNFVKNTSLRVVYSTLSSMFGYSDETLFLFFDMLHSHAIVNSFRLFFLVTTSWYGMEAFFHRNIIIRSKPRSAILSVCCVERCHKGTFSEDPGNN